MDELKIRISGPQDVAFIVQSQLSMAEETEGMSLQAESVNEGVRHVMADQELGFYLCAEFGAEEAGCMLVLKEWSDWRNGEVWWIHSLYVLPRFRKNGVFRSMYLWLKKRVEDDPGIHGIRLYVDSRNERAMQAYRAMGMNAEHYTLFEWLKPDAPEKK